MHRNGRFDNQIRLSDFSNYLFKSTVEIENALKDQEWNTSDSDTQREKNKMDSLNVPKGHHLFQKLCFK